MKTDFNMKTKKIHTMKEILTFTFMGDVTIREIKGPIHSVCEPVSIQSGSVQRRFHICSEPLPGPFQTWARDFFNEESRLNTLLDTHAVFNSYKDTLPSPWCDLVKLRNWKSGLKPFANQRAGNSIRRMSILTNIKRPGKSTVGAMTGAGMCTESISGHYDNISRL